VPSAGVPCLCLAWALGKAINTPCFKSRMNTYYWLPECIFPRVECMTSKPETSRFLSVRILSFRNNPYLLLHHGAHESPQPSPKWQGPVGRTTWSSSKPTMGKRC
jgi:hypothetical protein